MSNQTFMRAIRPVVGIAFLSLLAGLALTGSANAKQAERPGWWSAPAIVQGEPKVGSTLAGSDGALRCDPRCEPREGEPEPTRPGRYFQWLRCTSKHGGGKAAPAGGLPDEGGPCPGAVIIVPESNIITNERANYYTVRPEDAGTYIQMEVIARNYDCGIPRSSDGYQECRYVESHAWSSTIGPIIPLGPPPPPPPPPAIAPTYTALPAITGEAEDMQTLTVSNGVWNGTPTPTLTYQWLRCSRANQGCKPVDGATASTYKLTADDVATRVTAMVTARNIAGSFSAAAPLTAKIAAAHPRPGSDMLDVAQLLPRQRLRIQSVKFAPTVLRAGARWIATVSVVDGRGFLIKGAQVAVQDELGDVTSNLALTNDRGIATVRIRTTKFLPRGRVALDVTAARPTDTTNATTKRVSVVVG